MKTTILLLLSFLTITVNSQENMRTTIPYHTIPEAPSSYTPASVAARMIDGLGFRYYWVTDSLRPEDLAFKPSVDGRTTAETVDHIYSLSKTINNTIFSRPNVKQEEAALSFEEKREKTLQLLYDASIELRKNPDLADLNIVFGSGENTREYPFWNLINGPIADAIWHTGQIVSFRRTSGNPFTSSVSLFSGKVRE